MRSAAPRLSERRLQRFAEELAGSCEHLKLVLAKYGPPPMWAREPGFASLLKIILEQQVSLASANACYDRLELRVGSVTPHAVIASTDAELKADGFSRQKISYARHLALAVIDGTLDLAMLGKLDDIAVKDELKKLKGVGEWTSDVYLLMALRRPDIMPKGDVALHSSWQCLSGNGRPTSEEFVAIAERWRPYRSVAARMLWHFYLSEKALARQASSADV